MAGTVFSSLANDEGDCLFVGFRVAKNQFAIGPHFIFKEKRYAIAVNRDGVGALEELLSVEIGSNYFNRQLEISKRGRDRIGHRVLPILTQSRRFGNQRRRKEPCGPKSSTCTLPPECQVREPISSRVALR